MTALGQWRATYAPGDWLVLCGPTSLVVVEPPGAGWTPLASALWDEVVASSSIVDLAARLAGYGLNTMPSFGALFWTADGMRSLVRGSVRIVDPGTGRVIDSGQGVQTWSETGLGELTVVRIETATSPEPDALRLPVVVGAVRASSVLLDARPPSRVHSPQLEARSTTPSGDETPAPGDVSADEPAESGERPAATSRTEREPAALPTTEALPAPATGGPVATGTMPLPDLDPAETADTEPVEPAGADAAGAGNHAVNGPTALAVLCPYGHANRPGSERCSDCGVRVVDTDPRPVPQPVLATLRVSDGTELPLDRLVLVGRAPTPRGPGPGRLLTVPSPSQDISRTHLEIAPDGWQVRVTDLNSTNGTVLVGPDGHERHTLPPGESVPVALGSVLELAEGVSVLLDLPH